MKRNFRIALAGLALGGATLGADVACAQDRTAEEITRRLNSGPPVAYATPNAPPVTATPAPGPAPAVATRIGAQPVPYMSQTPQPQAQATQQNAAQLPRGPVIPSNVRPVAARYEAPNFPSPTLTTSPMVAAAPGASGNARPATQPRPEARPQPIPVAPSGVPTTDLPPPAAVPSYRVLTNEEYMALPFTAEIPSGMEIGMGRPGPDFTIFSIRRNGVSLVMIFAGTSSQFPIYDGEMVQAGGRTSIIINEDGRRTAMEHLFESQTAPQELHVWVATVQGADRILAERIAQSVDRK